MRDKQIETSAATARESRSTSGTRLRVHPTNIVFETDEELDTYVSKLAYSAGKHVSLASR